MNEQLLEACKAALAYFAQWTSLDEQETAIMKQLADAIESAEKA